jgi:hypothetical protein
MHEVRFWLWTLVMFVPVLTWPQWMSNFFEEDVYVLLVGHSRLIGSIRVIVAECSIPFLGPGLVRVSGNPDLRKQFAKPILRSGDQDTALHSGCWSTHILKHSSSDLVWKKP